MQYVPIYYVPNYLLQAIEFCRSNHIHLLSLPPHSSHKMQPLDRVFFGPLKSKYAAKISHWMLSNPGQPVHISKISPLFAAAYNQVANIDKGVNGFACTGIFPYNPDVFSDDDFAPAEVTDRSYQLVFLE